MKMTVTLARLFSFTSLTLAWIAARITKFYLYGAIAFLWKWNKEPSLWMNTEFFFGTVIGGEAALCLLIAIALDWLSWPIFFRGAIREVKTIES